MPLTKVTADGIGTVTTLTATGDLTVNSTKFTVSSSTGNTVVAGTLGVTGTITGSASGTGNYNLFGTSLILQAFDTNNTWLSDNLYYAPSGFIYKANGYGGMVYFGASASGAIDFRTAPSGTAGAVATVTTLMTLSNLGLLTVSGFGTHTFNGGNGSNATNWLVVRNTMAGTAARAGMYLSSSSGNLYLTHNSASYTTSGLNIADSAAIQVDSAGGLSVGATHASGIVRFYAGGGTLRAQVHSNGIFYVESGSISAGGTNTDLSLTAVGAGGYIYFYTNGLQRWNISNAGNFQQVGGNGIKFDGTGYAQTTWSTTASGANAYVSDGYYLQRSTSLRQYKNVGAAIDYDEGVRVLFGLTPVHYTSKIATDDIRGMVGLIAEDVELVTNTLAQYNKDTLSGVAYDRVPMYLLPVVKHHDTTLTTLTARIAALETELATLKAMLTA